MNKRERERLTAQENALVSLGFTASEADTLRRISRALRRWHELECGTDAGCIERDDATGKPYWVAQYRDNVRRWPVADRERGALRRLGRIMADRNGRLGLPADARNWRCDDGTYDIVDDDGDVVRQNLPANAALLTHYVQTDPRGAALYILRPGDVPEGVKPESCYTNGICVY